MTPYHADALAIILRQYAVSCRTKQRAASNDGQESLRLIYSFLRLHANDLSWFMQPGNVACVINGLPHYKFTPLHQQIDGIYPPRVRIRIPKVGPRQLGLFEGYGE